MSVKIDPLPLASVIFPSKVEPSDLLVPFEYISMKPVFASTAAVTPVIDAALILSATLAKVVLFVVTVVPLITIE